jgi:hypothetical protein
MLAGLLPHAHRATSARRVLMAMLAAGAVPDPLRVTNTTFQGNMFGVHVNCCVFDLKPHRWADVSLSGGLFGTRCVSGRAWYEFDDYDRPEKPRIRMEKQLERVLRRYHVKVLSVYESPPPEKSLMLDLSLPAIGQQRMLLWRVPNQHERWCEL